MAVGVLWCREMLGRWPRDIEAFRKAKDPSTRQVLVALWAMTAVIALLLVNFFVGILGNIGVL